MNLERNRHDFCNEVKWNGMELVIIEMNECFVVEIFSEALGSEAVFFWDFLVVYRELRRY